MLTVEDYGKIRRAHRDGMSIRAIARTFHHSRHKVRIVLAQPEPRPYTRSKDPPAPKLGAFKPIIEQILKADQDAPRKQRHTAMQMFRRLRDEHHYPGGYDQVRRYVAKQRRNRRETFIPLSHDPGQRMECDFGHIYVDFPEGRRQVPVLIVVWAYSNYPFAMAMPTERTEAILAGMVEAFEFFDCLPQEVWWDNPKTVATKIFKGRQRQPHERYAALASHYAFDPLFCMPASGNEKPYAENRVFDLQRRFATPVPKVKDLAELNAHLRRCCQNERRRTVAGKRQTIGTRFEHDRALARSLPAHGFDPCVRQEARVDKYQTVRFDNIRYSVPRVYAYQTVTVKGYINHVEVVVSEKTIARHDRSYDPEKPGLDPVHFLVSLGRRPAALDHADVYRKWRLPAVFLDLRKRLEDHHGPAAGVRQYIRVLQLLAEHPLVSVQKAVERSLNAIEVDGDRIVSEVKRWAAKQTDRSFSVDGNDLSDHVLEVRVTMPDVRCFNQLLSQGDGVYVRSREPAA